MTDIMDIDGSMLEGGGQILRNSISLSAILAIPVRVYNIRAGRSKPGLAAQHLKGIQLVADICQGKLKGAQIGSTEIEFIPGKIKGGHYVADTKTAGSISLLLQVALPCALMADGPITVDMKGGTNADMAPQIDFMIEVFLPMFRKFGTNFVLDIHRRGYYPRGGGHVTMTVDPVKSLSPVDITERGEIQSIRGWSYAAGTLPAKMAYQMSDGVKSQLRSVYKNIDIKCYKEDRNMAPDNCSGIIMKCELTSGSVLGSDGLGKRGVDAFELGSKVGETLREVIESGACVDTHVQDQLIIYMALADGVSAIRTGEVTLHTKTAIHVAELLAKTKFTITPLTRNQNIIECTGLGLINKNLPPE